MEDENDRRIQRPVEDALVCQAGLASSHAVWLRRNPWPRQALVRRKLGAGTSASLMDVAASVAIASINPSPDALNTTFGSDYFKAQTIGCHLNILQNQLLTGLLWHQCVSERED